MFTKQKKFRYVFALAALLAVEVSAADYSLGYDVGSNYFYTDNVNGSSADPVSANARVLTTTLKSARATENHETNLDLGFNFYDYNVEGYNTQNQNLQFRDIYRLERNTFTLDAGLVRDSTNTSQQFREQASVETRFSADRREQADWNIGWENQLTETNRLNFGATHTDINYDNLDDVGYRSTGYSASVSEILSETTYVFLQYNRNDSDSDRYETFPTLASTQQSTKSHGIALGLNYAPDEYLLVNGYLGKNTIETDPNGEDTSGFCQTIIASSFIHCAVLAEQKITETDTTYADINVTWTYDIWDVKAGFDRSQQPDNNGELLEYDRWSTSGTYRLDEKNKITGGIVYRMSNGVVSLPGEDPGDRDYWDYSIRWSNQMTESWSIFSNISYYETTEPSRSGDDLVTEAWRYTIGITYSPAATHWSR